MKKLTSNQNLRYLIELCTEYLDQLKDVKDSADEQFLYGEKTAYVECLEIIQLWEHALTSGLDYDVESRYPL